MQTFVLWTQLKPNKTPVVLKQAAPRPAPRHRLCPVNVRPEICSAGRSLWVDGGQSSACSAHSSRSCGRWHRRTWRTDTLRGNFELTDPLQPVKDQGNNCRVSFYKTTTWSAAQSWDCISYLSVTAANSHPVYTVIITAEGSRQCKWRTCTLLRRELLYFLLHYIYLTALVT